MRERNDELEFEWDDEKAIANYAKHGVSFLSDAATFNADRIERLDDREAYGELRFIALGRVGVEAYRIVYTWRGENRVRIISAQRAAKHERELYYRHTFS